MMVCSEGFLSQKSTTEIINQLYIIKKLQVSGSGACNHHLLNHIPNSFYFNLLVHVSTIFAWLQSSDCVSFLA